MRLTRNLAEAENLLQDTMLSAVDRAVINRSYYLGWTTAQIADDLHIAEWFVKSRLHFAARYGAHSNDTPIAVHSTPQADNACRPHLRERTRSSWRLSRPPGSASRRVWR